MADSVIPSGQKIVPDKDLAFGRLEPAVEEENEDEIPGKKCNCLDLRPPGD